jgi:hypothetical protein
MYARTTIGAIFVTKKFIYLDVEGFTHELAQSRGTFHMDFWVLRPCYWKAIHGTQFQHFLVKIGNDSERPCVLATVGLSVMLNKKTTSSIPKK